MLVKQISVFLENKKGRLADLTQTLAEHKVNICAMSIADTTDFGILRLIAKDPKEVETMLKENGFIVSCTDVIAVSLPHGPGSLARVLSILTDKEIEVEYVYAYIGKRADEALVLLKTDDPLKAVAILIENGVNVMPDEKLYEI